MSMSQASFLVRKPFNIYLFHLMSGAVRVVISDTKYGDNPIVIGPKENNPESFANVTITNGILNLKGYVQRHRRDPEFYTCISNNFTLIVRGDLENVPK